VIREVSSGNISTVAGTPGSCGYAGDGAVATGAQLDLPEGVFVASGGIFIADADNNLIRVVNPGTSPITIAGVNIPATYIQTVAGTFYDSQGGTACGFANNGQIATTAQLCAPAGVFVDGSGNIFIADTNNFAIREVAASTTNILTTAAGTLGTAGYSANGTAASSAELNYPSNMVVDTSGNIYIADTDNFVIEEVTAANSAIQTTIGNNKLAYSGDGGLAADAELYSPGAVALDSAGNIYIADSSNSVIRVVNTGTAAITIAGVSIQPGDIETVAGSYYLPAGPGIGTYSNQPVAATSAQLGNPGGVFIDASGNIYIADTENNVIRVVNPSATQAVTIAGVTIPAGDIATVAGDGTLCQFTTAPCGDGGAATSAELNTPNAIFVDSAGNIFIVDTDDYVIREVTATGIISTVAGNYAQCTQSQTACGDGATATSAQLNSPYGISIDSGENLYIADTFDNRVRVAANPNATQAVTIAGVSVPPGDIATIAGTGARGYGGDNGPPTSAQLDTPSAVYVDSAGDVFVADTENAAIREIVAASGLIQTVAGTPPTSGFSGDGGQSTNAELNFPRGVFGNSAGDLFVADTDNARIRELVPSIFVTVSPNPINVAVSAQEQFTATVSGTSNPVVIWEVNGVAGGNSTVGTITTTGVFTAPATIPSPATVAVTAVSAADNTSSGSAQTTIVDVGDALNVVVSTNPPVTQVYTTTTQTFIATVTGTSNTAVTWQVSGITGGNATVGTIDTSGNYTAPSAVPSPATVTIEAVSQALSSAIGTESIQIVTNPSAAEPSPQTVSPGGSATYSLLLNANTGAPGQPITLSCLQATMPPGGSCSFSSSGTRITSITPGTQAVPFSLTITVPTGSAAWEMPNRSHRYLAFAVLTPLFGIFLVGAGCGNKLRKRRQVWVWLTGLCIFLALLNACGGTNSSSTPKNPELGTYNIKVQGTTTAQPNPATITIAGLTVAQ
jgi:trimeric autotransporter adhesin